MSKLKDEAEPLRYERKFLITDYTPSDVEQFIKFHPFRFTEIFHQRQINNIYFDTLGFGHYYDNVEGSPDRLKVRIRWYGNLFGPVSHPVLEYKIKKGLLGENPERLSTKNALISFIRLCIACYQYKTKHF